MRNPIQHYAWGSREVLARLQGRPVPSPEPEAELWVGAHPSAPSVVVRDGRDEPLEGLPFLLKILAIDAPLSIQVHPSPEQAEAGFEREQRAGIPLDDPRRNYKDRSAKPETVVALTGVAGTYNPEATEIWHEGIRLPVPAEPQGVKVPALTGGFTAARRGVSATYARPLTNA